MRTLIMLGTILGLACVWNGCKSEDEDELPAVDCAAAAAPGFSEVSAFSKCASCHSSDKSGDARKEAPTDINFDTYNGATMDAMKAAEEVNDGSMPPKDSGLNLSQEEKDQLYRWVLCGMDQ